MEFIYLLQTALLNYGPLICQGVHQQVKSISSKQGTSSHSRQHSHDGANGNIRHEGTEHGNGGIAGTREMCSRETQTDEPVGQTSAPQLTPPQRQNQRLPSHPPNRSRNEQQPQSQHRQNNNISSQNNQPSETDPATTALRATIRSMKVSPDTQHQTLDFSSIAGLTHIKSTIEEIAHLLLYFPHLTTPLRRGHSTPSGILLFGPQGTGKTLLVRSFAAKYNLALYDIRASAIMSKFVGESEKFIKVLFEEVCENAPAVLLLDECEGLLCDPGKDAMQSHHYRLLQNELKNCWSDLMYSGREVLVVGVTNKPGDIDMDGFGRRLSVKLAVGLPSGEVCRDIVAGRLRQLRHGVREEEVVVLGEMCGEKGLTGYDVDCFVEGVLRRGVRRIMAGKRFRRVMGTEDRKEVWVPCEVEEGISEGEDDQEGMYRNGGWRDVAADGSEVTYPAITFEDLENAVNKAVPTVDQYMLRRHEEFAKVYATRVE